MGGAAIASFGRVKPTDEKAIARAVLVADSNSDLLELAWALS